MRFLFVLAAAITSGAYASNCSQYKASYHASSCCGNPGNHVLATAGGCGTIKIVEYFTTTNPDLVAENFNPVPSAVAAMSASMSAYEVFSNGVDTALCIRTIRPGGEDDFLTANAPYYLIGGSVPAPDAPSGFLTVLHNYHIQLGITAISHEWWFPSNASALSFMAKATTPHSGDHYSFYSATQAGYAGTGAANLGLKQFIKTPGLGMDTC